MKQPYRILPAAEGRLGALDDPVLVTMLTGWIDASGAAAAAMDRLLEATRAEAVVEFDDDVFVDYRARRPAMHLVDGVIERLEWSVPRLWIGVDALGHDVMLLAGPEPDTNWRTFADTVAAIAARVGVSRAVGLGAYPIATPHTRPVLLSCTAARAEVIADLPFARSSLVVPAGMEAVLERSLDESGIPALAIWAQVPHYVTSMAYPASSLALLEALRDVAGVHVDVSELREEAVVQRGRLDGLVAANREHAEMLSQLERLHDQTRGTASPPALGPGALPTGDEIAAELEQFLRQQGGD